MVRGKQLSNTLKKIYKKLFTAFGPQHWWPGDTPFEVIVGARLTQNTAWTNVEKAIHNLKRENLLSPERLFRINKRRLAGLIRPAGYVNIKSGRLEGCRIFFLVRYQGSLKKMFKK